MELNKIDEQIKALQKKKREAIKKQEEKIKSELLKKVIGNNFENILSFAKAFRLTMNSKFLQKYGII